MIKVTVEVDGQPAPTQAPVAPAATALTPTAAPGEASSAAIQKAIAGGAYDGGPAPALSASQGATPLAASIAASGASPELPAEISAGPASHEPTKVQP